MRADWIKLMMAAARRPACSEPAKSQLALLCAVEHKRAYVQSVIMRNRGRRCPKRQTRQACSSTWRDSGCT